MLIRLIEVFVLGSIKTCSPLINVEALLTSISFLYLSWSILSQEFAEYRYTFYKNKLFARWSNDELKNLY